MKVLVVALLCTLAAVQGRSAFGEFSAAAGENPYVVHIRLATTDNNGLLSTCAGSLIGSRWVLTSSSCVANSRFIWLRFGAVDVTRPELLTEGNLPVRVENGLALLNISRVVEENDNIRRVSLPEADSEIPESGKLCIFGAQNDAPGTQLSCSNVALEVNEGGDIVADTVASNFDLGAALVSDGVQVGVLNGVGDSSVFVSVAKNREWINQVTGL